MKRSAFMILALILCLFLCACGESTNGEIVVGQWKGSDGSVLTFFEGGGVKLDGDDLPIDGNPARCIWSVEDDRVIIQVLSEPDSDGRMVLEIVDEKIMTCGSVTYTKKRYVELPVNLY